MKTTQSIFLLGVVLLFVERARKKERQREREKLNFLPAFIYNNVGNFLFSCLVLFTRLGRRKKKKSKEAEEALVGRKDKSGGYGRKSRYQAFSVNRTEEFFGFFSPARLQKSRRQLPFSLRRTIAISANKGNVFLFRGKHEPTLGRSHRSLPSSLS